MSRVKRGVIAHARHKKILNMAKGYRGRNKNVFRVAVEKVEKAYIDRALHAGQQIINPFISNNKSKYNE